MEINLFEKAASEFGLNPTDVFTTLNNNAYSGVSPNWSDAYNAAIAELVCVGGGGNCVSTRRRVCISQYD